MTETQQAQLDALDDDGRLAVAQAARVFAQDLGLSAARAIEHCLDEPGDVARLGARLSALADQLRRPVAEARGQGTGARGQGSEAAAEIPPDEKPKRRRAAE
ncbi:MAG: hypothetical protein IPM64_17985 [Phycisphaerales bacterium]|nr:hypothetical protein [Phycisphaerales bacterium]